MNPCKPELLARAYNRVKSNAKVTTADSDIAYRSLLALDFDPVRPSGISSSDREHGRAISVACGVWDELRAVGWGDPIVASSGNGAHLVYKLAKWPNTSEVSGVIQGLIKGIAKRCGTDDVSIDLTVFNASRIGSCTAHWPARVILLAIVRIGERSS